MTHPFRKRRALVLALGLIAIAITTGGLWRSAYIQGLEPVAARGLSDLELASDRLVTQLQRFREFAVLTADHPALMALHRGADTSEAEAMLLRAADRSGAVLAAYLDAGGRILAQSGPGLPRAVVEGAPFSRALDGALGISHGAGPGDIERAFYFAAPSFGPDGRVMGALVVAVNMARLEQVWRGSLPAVFFTDSSGEIFATNRSELLHWRRVGTQVMSPEGALKELTLRYPGGNTVWVQRFSPYIPARALRLQLELPVIGMTGVLLVDITPAERLAGLQAAVVAVLLLFFGTLLWVAFERRRVLWLANAELEERVSARTRALEQSNVALRREITERQEAEAALTRAQAELVQASKLSALGKMSAGISHELNQPLMAIRSFAENGAAFLERGRQDRAAENLGRISDMASRMGRIIKNLRAFARAEPEPARRVGLAAVVESALEVLGERIVTAGVEIDWQRPDRTTVVMAGEVRLAQVVVNLIANAMDAMKDSADHQGAERRIVIRVAHDDAAGLVRLTVRDTGPGISDPSRIFDPFYSTKEVGGEEGMGLGLSISYGIVEGFGGRLRGENAEGGGAEFTVELLQAGKMGETA